MILNVKYLAPYSFALGKKNSSFTIPDKDSISVWELLEHIARNEPRFTKVAILERESVLNKLTVLVEGVACNLDANVMDGANIVVMSPICGG